MKLNKVILSGMCAALMGMTAVCAYSASSLGKAAGVETKEAGEYAVLGEIRSGSRDMGEEITEEYVLSKGIRLCSAVDISLGAPAGNSDERYKTDAGVKKNLAAESGQGLEQATIKEGEVPLAAKKGVYADSLLLWKSFYEPLTEADLQGLSISELRFARNELYAAYGRQFKALELQEYFASKAWYKGTVAPEAFSDSVLTDVQKKNAAFILQYEKTREATLVKLTSDVWGVPNGMLHYRSVDGVYDFTICRRNGRTWIADAVLVETGEELGYFGARQFSLVNDTELWEIDGDMSMYFDDYGTILVIVDVTEGKIKCVYTGKEEQW